MARLRLLEQTETHRRFVQAQRKDERSTFIYSLVSAYKCTKHGLVAPEIRRASEGAASALAAETDGGR